ncbi:hypothetical protein [Bradyrhizobium sp. RDT46]|uniref:hypothetical protein n=1 Tax=Bradyrhizobium sp. RDT46 TaxID=3341829 RepID=UPI0035C75278
MTEINDFETELFEARKMLSERLGVQLPPELRLRQTTPPPDETTLLFCRSAGFDRLEYLDVKPTPAARPGRSYDNVREHMVRRGGCVVHGWIVRAVPMLFYEAEYHAIWQSPEGALVDITPQPGDESGVFFAPVGHPEPAPSGPPPWPAKKRARISDLEDAKPAEQRVSPLRLPPGQEQRLAAALDKFLVLADRHDGFVARMGARAESPEYVTLANDLVEAKVRIFLMVEGLMMSSMANTRASDKGPSAPSP